MCDCIRKANEKLEPMNTMLDIPIAIDMSTGQETEPRVIVATAKIDSKKRTPKRMLSAAYCPFCGVKYPASKWN